MCLRFRDRRRLGHARLWYRCSETGASDVAYGGLSRPRVVAKRKAGENISYGSAGLQVVIDLIVDDGVPSRGHRKNILDPGFHDVGIAIGPHLRYGTMCVMDLTSAQ